MARRNPAIMVGSQATGRDDAVHMGMMLQSLVPGMEHAEEADFGTEVAGITRDLEQGVGAGTKQQTVDQALILQREWSQLARQGENNVQVARGQQFAFPCLEPANTGVALASWAMPVTARVVRDGRVSAVRALIAMST